MKVKFVDKKMAAKMFCFMVIAILFTSNFFNANVDTYSSTRRSKTPSINLAALRDGSSFMSITSWVNEFKRITSNSAVSTETIDLYIDRGALGAVKVSIDVPARSALSTEADFQTVATYIMLEMNNALTLYRGQKVVINANQNLYDEVIKQFYSTGRSGFDIGDFLGTVNETNQFEFARNNSQLSQVDQDMIASAQAVSSLFDCADSRIQMIDKSQMHGYAIGLDFGGSDVKVSLLKDGESIFEKKLKWNVQEFESIEEHRRHALALVDFARHYVALEMVKDISPGHIAQAYRALFAKMQQEKSKDENSIEELEMLVEQSISLGVEPENIVGLGISVALAIYNGRLTGPGPMVAGLGLSGPNVDPEVKEAVAVFGFNLGVALGLTVDRIKIINDGDAGAAWAATELGINNAIAWSLGTGLATGYIDQGGRIATDMLTEGGNVVMDVAQLYSDNPVAHSVTKVPGALQQYLSQRSVVRMVEEKGILDVTHSDFLTSSGKLDQRKVLLTVQEMYVNETTTPEIRTQIREIFETVGVYLAHSAVQHNTYLGIENVIIFGQVVTGPLGDVVTQKAQQILDNEYKDLGITIYITEDPAFAQAIGVGYLGYSP